MSVRINPSLLPDLLASIQQSRQNENAATQELSSGRTVNNPSDNPAATAAVVLNHGQSGQDAQFLQNISTLQGRFQTADSTLSNVVQVLTQALSLGTEGANSTVSDSDRQAIATEVQGLLTQTVGLANTTYQGACLFGGTNVNAQPFTLDSTTGAVTYNGNSKTTSVEISQGNSITANVPGDRLFQNGSGSVLGALQDLYTALTTATNMPAAVTEVQSALSQLGVQRVTYGNALNQINQNESFLNQDKLNLSEQENTLEGADLSAVATNFAQAQLAVQATLSATSRVLSQKTLLDYLA
ncbi:MAG TPA: flagellar hook-associated protein FlgL [Terracidiphilus sp.]|nr:flagellar hook-associated protein FlgL [Terracidiphilus sp.]